MTTGNLKCWKEVCNPCKCDDDCIVEPGQTLIYKIHFENHGLDPIVGTLTDVLPEYLDAPSWSEVATGGATWGYTGVAGSETYEGHVFLPPGSTMVFTMEATVEDPRDQCPAVITNCATFRISSRGWPELAKGEEPNPDRPVQDLAVCDYEYKYLVAPTQIIRNKDGDTGELCFCPDEKNKCRSTDQEQMIWAFLGKDDECAAQFIMDCLENGLTLADLLRDYKERH